MVLRGTRSVPGLQFRSVEISPRLILGPSHTFTHLIASNEAEPLTASVTLFLFFTIVAMMGWDRPDWQVKPSLMSHLHSP